MAPSELSSPRSLDHGDEDQDLTARGALVDAHKVIRSEPSSRLGLGLFVVASIGAVVLYLSYIATYGVNVVFWDDWSWAPLVAHGHPTLATLWEQYNENIVFFPNLLAYAVIRLTAWNTLVFFWISALLLLGVLGLVTRVFWDEIRRAPLVWLPVPFIVLTLAQNQNTLWAFQVAWFIVLLCIVGALVLLERPERSTWHLVAAALVGIVGSYSSLQGLLVWPAGLVILLSSGWSRRVRLIWCAIAAVVIAGYFAGFDFAQSQSASLHYILGHLPSALEGVLLTAGSVVPSNTSSFSAISSGLITAVVGAVLLVAGVLVIADWVAKKRPGGPKAFCVALIVMSILFDLLLIPSRLVFYSYAGTQSRYDTFMWPLLLGVYAYLVMHRPPRHSRSVRWVRAPQVAIALVVGAALVVGTAVGVDQGRVTKEVRTTAIDVLANWQVAPTAVSAPYLYPPCAASDPSPCAFLRDAERVLATNRWSIFGDPGGLTTLRAGGIVPGGVATRPLVVPPSLRASVGASASSRAAWAVLSTVYPADPWLHSYPYSEPQIRELLAWAVSTGRVVNGPAVVAAEWGAPVSVGFFLVQHVSTYERWASRLAPGRVARSRRALAQGTWTAR